MATVFNTGLTTDINHLKDNIHPTAVVSPHATIHPSVHIGPYVIIGDHVTIDEETRIESFAKIEGHTTIGKRNFIASGAIIGNRPQDLKYNGEASFVEIGDDNQIREYVTINRGTEGGGLVTRIGNNNLLMTSSHVAHDATVGNRNVIAHSSLIGGHVEVDDCVVTGGLSAVHQYCKIGSYSLLGAGSIACKDLAPFTLAKGNPAKFYGLNRERLSRLGLDGHSRSYLKKCYQLIFQSSLTTKEAIVAIKDQLPETKEIRIMLDFLNRSNRGVYR